MRGIVNNKVGIDLHREKSNYPRSECYLFFGFHITGTYWFLFVFQAIRLYFILYSTILSLLPQGKVSSVTMSRKSFNYLYLASMQRFNAIKKIIILYQIQLSCYFHQGIIDYNIINRYRSSNDYQIVIPPLCAQPYDMLCFIYIHRLILYLRAFRHRYAIYIIFVSSVYIMSLFIGNVRRGHLNGKMVGILEFETLHSRK